jgi:hypothetical protein
VPQPEAAAQSEEESRASFRQAASLMHAGISSSFAGRDDDALFLFRAAQTRFKKLGKTFDAGVARAWIDAMKREHTPA